MRYLTVLAAVISATSAVPAIAADGENNEAGEGAFTLGQIVVTGNRGEGLLIGGETLTAQAMEAFNRNSLEDAANLMPGVAASNSGGSRNEKLIYVRGFDRFQVPLSIDGIRVYLPADNRLDYGRFLTPDIAEIQVAKGYASVLDGPGGMGGAVNLVTRKPTKAFEAEVRGVLDLDRDADYAGYTAFGLIGTRHDKWYGQVSFARTFRDHWDLPGGFTPTDSEDGGARDFSRTKDWRLNLKLGFTPNDTDEYSISYTRQEGAKNAPLHVTDPASSQRNWTWPWWNVDSIYFLSTTALTPNVTLKTRIYRNGFDNLLRAFDDATQTTQTKRRAFNSYYEDVAWGGSAQLAIDVSPADTLTLAAHFRRDKHVEYQQSFPSGFVEPKQHNEEDTWSVAAENRLALSPELTLVLGASYDWRDLKRAEEYGTPPEGGDDAIFSYPIRDADAVNGQGQLVWTPDDVSSVHFSVSSRVRFPSIFERFSSRFGGAVSNPDLKAERATNFEIGGSRRFGSVYAEGAVFYSHLTDVIVAFPMIYEGESVTQSRNLGKGDYYGVELSLDAAIGDTLTVGANYTYVHRDLDDPTNSAFQPTGVPTHKAFLYAEWQPLPPLHVRPSMEIASDRWTVTTDGSLYYRTGSYVQANLSIDYDILEDVSIGVGVRNAFDDSYQLTDGFPEPGRRFSLTARAKY
ncbi:MAG: TonB-dependent receptor [Novosphingobium sp.]|nr:TonB-dependent receptor [Novosphingobium sp.]